MTAAASGGRWIGGLVGLAMTSVVGLTTTAASERTLRVHEFAPGKLSLVDLAGEVTVRRATEHRIRIEMTGTAQQLADVSIAETEGGVTVTGKGISTSHGTVVANNRINLAIGGHAVSTIGGSETAPAEEPLSVVVAAPAGTRLGASGVIGSYRIDDLEAPIELSVRAATVHVAHMRDGRLAIDGAGAATVDRVSGRIVLDVGGQGSIAVAGGEVAGLSASLAGAGEITAEVTARRARLRAPGIGRIFVSSVTEAVDIEQQMLSQVIVDNRPPRR